MKKIEKQESVDLVIDNFKIQFDCLDKEKETLEKKLKLISLGNGKDLCIITCGEKGCKAAELKVRSYDNIHKEYYKNGGIEIEVTESNISFMVQNYSTTYFVPDRKIFHIGYHDRGL